MSSSSSPTAAAASAAVDADISARPPLSSSFSSGASSTSSHCSRCSSTRPSSGPSQDTQAGSSTVPHRRFLSRADITASLDAHDGLLGAAKDFRLACMAKAKASAALAGALDSCSRVKGADHSGPGLQAAAGFHYVLASTERVVADRLYKTFEIPLLETRDSYHAASAERSAAYSQALAIRTKKIRETEEGHLRPPLSRAASSAKKGSAGGGGVGRDLGMLKETLRVLQEQIDELERVKGDYCDEVLDAEQMLWSTVLSRTGTVLRAELASTVTLGAKADDQVIAQVLLASPDPYLEDDDERKLKEAGSVLTSLPSLPPSSGPSTTGTPAASGPSTPKAITTSLPSESRAASLFGAADDLLEQEVEALLSPRLTRRDPSTSSFFEEATPKQSQRGPTDGGGLEPTDVSLSESSSSSSSSSDSSDDEVEGDQTISPGSHQPQRRKSLPFPASVGSQEAPVSLGPDSTGEAAVSEFSAETPAME